MAKISKANPHSMLFGFAVRAINQRIQGREWWSEYDHWVVIRDWLTQEARHVGDDSPTTALAVRMANLVLKDNLHN